MIKNKKQNLELIEWVSNKDYSTIYSSEHKQQWTVATLLEQLEIRLEFIEHALNNSGRISNRIQWKQLNERNLIDLPKFSQSVVIGEHCQLQYKAGLRDLLEMEANLAHRHRQDEFVIETLDGEMGAVVYLPLSTLTDAQIIQDLTYNLAKIRAQLAIPEPTLEAQRTQMIGAIRSIKKYRAIDYLDILIWAIQKHQLSDLASINEVISLGEIASALNTISCDHDEHIDTTTVSTWRRDFYSKKLFDKNWFQQVSINIKKDKSLMSSTLLDALTN
ncbi:DUF6387 family protein [Vibrio alfacsensis]|uniref:DUF6387 family protein n=1 Tax=Vibrio TaxID=662 RepID=UPI0040690BCB